MLGPLRGCWICFFSRSWVKSGNIPDQVDHHCIFWIPPPLCPGWPPLQGSVLSSTKALFYPPPSETSGSLVSQVCDLPNKVSFDVSCLTVTVYVLAGPCGLAVQPSSRKNNYLPTMFKVWRKSNNNTTRPNIFQGGKLNRFPSRIFNLLHVAALVVLFDAIHFDHGETSEINAWRFCSIGITRSVVHATNSFFSQPQSAAVLLDLFLAKLMSQFKNPCNLKAWTWSWRCQKCKEVFGASASRNDYGSGGASLESWRAVGRCPADCREGNPQSFGQTKTIS